MGPSRLFPFLYFVLFPQLLVDAAACESQVDDSRCTDWFPTGNCNADTPEKKHRRCPRLCEGCEQTGGERMMHVRGPVHRPPRRPSRRLPHQRPRARPFRPRPRRAVNQFFANRLDTTVDPCVDFYEFACGTYRSRHQAQNPFRDFSTRIDQHNQIQHKHMNLIMKTSASTSQAVKTMIAYRDKCLDVKSEEPEWTRALLENMMTLESHFLVSGNQIEHLATNMAGLTGTQFMYQFGVEEIGRNKFQATIRAPNLLVSSPYFYTGDNVQEKMIRLKDYIRAVVRLIGTDNQVGPQGLVNFEREVENIVELDRQLAQASILNGGNGYLYRMNQVKAQLTSINWTLYIDDNPLLANDVKTYFRQNPWVFLISNNAIHAVDAIYKTLNPRLVLNYLLIRFILEHVPYLDQRFVDARDHFNHDVYGIPRRVDRNVVCFAEVVEHFGLVSHHLYAKSFANENLVSTMRDMLKNLNATMSSILEAQPWMSQGERTLAGEKLHNLHMIIGIHSAAEDVENLNLQYARLDLSPTDDSFSRMNVKTKTYNDFMYMIQLLGHALIPRWPTTEATAQYSLRRNDLFVGIPLFQHPFPDHNQPAAFRYGLAGTIAARELTRAFDNEGAEFNSTGEFERWWTHATFRAFSQRQHHLIDLINGQRTVAENTADNGGIRVAYEAFRQEQRKQRREERIKHLPRREEHVDGYKQFNAEKTFFISYATYFCSSYTRETNAYLQQHDVHASDKFRVNWVLANYEKFADAFFCPLGTAMNPDNKLTVWESP